MSDYRTDRRYIGWRRKSGEYWRLSSELVFWYHKLEKGLCLPPASRRFFGADAARETYRLLEEWRSFRRDQDTPIFLAGVETLRAWHDRLEEAPPPKHNLELVQKIETLLALYPREHSFSTPISIKRSKDQEFEHLYDLFQSRRSVRDFDPAPVEFSMIEKAVAAAQLSPSACNRQPWHLHFYDKPGAIQTMLALQNGNTGFGQTVPLLAVLTTDLGTFFDASERAEPALDGGLFLMSFLLALQSQGISTCCLNWCVLPDVDRRCHAIGCIPEGEKILTFLAIGYARQGAVVPLSARRPISDVVRRHEDLSIGASS